MNADGKHLPTLFLVSCVSRKCATPAPARDLYTSDWFLKARAYVERTRSRWFILSAEYGLLDPDSVVAPYERALNRMAAAERRAWANRVLASLVPLLSGRERLVFLAGDRYRELLIPVLRNHCSSIDLPLEGLGIGRQLHWLSERLREPT